MRQTLPHLASGRKPSSAPDQQAIARSGGDVTGEAGIVRRTVAENPVVVFATKDCCMLHVVKLLLHGQGVNPTVFAVDEANESGVVKELDGMIGDDARVPQFPAIFVGGDLLGGLKEMMGAHISGELVPRLREARALWL